VAIVRFEFDGRAFVVRKQWEELNLFPASRGTLHARLAARGEVHPPTLPPPLPARRNRWGRERGRAPSQPKANVAIQLRRVLAVACAQGATVVLKEGELAAARAALAELPAEELASVPTGNVCAPPGMRLRCPAALADAWGVASSRSRNGQS
jgi:hypothetical protein